MCGGGSYGELWLLKARVEKTKGAYVAELLVAVVMKYLNSIWCLLL